MLHGRPAREVILLRANQTFGCAALLALFACAGDSTTASDHSSAGERVRGFASVPPACAATSRQLSAEITRSTALTNRFHDASSVPNRSARSKRARRDAAGSRGSWTSSDSPIVRSTEGICRQRRSHRGPSASVTWWTTEFGHPRMLARPVQRAVVEVDCDHAPGGRGGLSRPPRPVRGTAA